MGAGGHEASAQLSPAPHVLICSPDLGLPSEQLNTWVPPGAAFHRDAGPAVAGPCRCGGLLTKEPGLAAWHNLQVGVLRGLWQVLGSGSQECVEVLQPRNLDELQVRERPHGVVGTIGR